MELQQYIKPKFILYGIALLFLVLGGIAVPRSISAQMLFLKHIEPGSLEFVNTFGLLKETFLTLFFSGLFIAMIGVMAMIINIKLTEMSIFLIVSTVIAYLLMGTPGLFVITLIYYFHETNEFATKMRDPEPGIVSSIGLSMTFIIIGLLGGIFAARGNIYFEPQSLEFASGFGRVWLGCPTNETVSNCIRTTSKTKIGYNNLISSCERENISPDVQLSCKTNVENLLNNAIDQQLKSYERMGKTDNTVGEFTTIALAQQLNLWVGTLPLESKFMMAMITFAMITALGFVLELLVPHIVNGLMFIFLRYNLIYPYKKEQECEYYVVLE